eukprot:762036-Hanusia_phi.AAC.3
MGAKISGEIRTEEQDMIGKMRLDGFYYLLLSGRVHFALDDADEMNRVEVVAVEASTSIRTFVVTVLATFLPTRRSPPDVPPSRTLLQKAVSESGYSRIPVYDDNIDNIIGMVLAKSLIDYLDKPGWVEGIKHRYEEKRVLGREQGKGREGRDRESETLEIIVR